MLRESYQSNLIGLSASSQNKKRQKLKVKNKFNIFSVGTKTYFHHQNGILVQKNRLKLATLNSCVMLLVAGGFFSFYQYGLPALRNVNYFQSQNTSAEEALITQQTPVVKDETPIKNEDEGLKSALMEKLALFSSDQKWSIFVYDLSSDSKVNINPDEKFDAASLYKLFLLEALEDKIPFDQWNYKYFDGVSLTDCVDSMLRTQDNACSESLARELGWDFVDDFNQKNGFKNTSLSGLDGRVTNAAEVGELLIRLKNGRILSDNTRRFVFDSLYQQHYSKGIAKGCGDCRVAGKTGELSGVSHDAAVVTHGGKSYVLVVLSSGSDFKQISQLTTVIDKYYGFKTK